MRSLSGLVSTSDNHTRLQSLRIVTELVPDFLDPPVFDLKDREMIARVFSRRIRRIFVALVPHHYDKWTVGEFQHRHILPLRPDVLRLMVGEAVNELFQAFTVNGLDRIGLDER
jgi:hypothetical protein